MLRTAPIVSLLFLSKRERGMKRLQNVKEKKKKLLHYFTAGERLLWSGSVALIIVSFLVFDRENYGTLFASLIGVTSLIFNAKGNPIGQLLMVLFSLLYGMISFTFRYFGEMFTYLGMTMPMALFALISWLRHPYEGKRAEVQVNRISVRETILMCAAAYAANDAVLILLWMLASMEQPRYISVVVCFAAFFVNDIYGFINWRKMERRQKKSSHAAECMD